MAPLYDFELMEQGGRIAGYRMTAPKWRRLRRGTALADPERFRQRYRLPEDVPVLLFAGRRKSLAGDGKGLLRGKKAETPEEQWASLPCRYALVEVVNLQDDGVEFEPIHRVCFGVEPNAVLAAVLSASPVQGWDRTTGMGRPSGMYRHHQGVITLPEQPARWSWASCSEFLDRHPEGQGGRVEYIHGGETADAWDGG